MPPSGADRASSGLFCGRGWAGEARTVIQQSVNGETVISLGARRVQRVGRARLATVQGFLRSNWHVLPNVVARPKNAPSRNASRTTARRVLRRSNVLSLDLSASLLTSVAIREASPPTKASWPLLAFWML